MFYGNNIGGNNFYGGGNNIFGGGGNMGGTALMAGLMLGSMMGGGEQSLLSPEAREEGGWGQGGQQQQQQQAMQMMEMGLLMGLLMGAMGGQGGMNQNPLAQMLQRLMGGGQNGQSPFGGGGNGGQCGGGSPYGGGGSPYGGGGSPYGGGGTPSSPGGGTYDGATGNSSPQNVQQNALIVARTAQQKGVDPVTAVATMLVESGGNNQAVGDNGSSFGLFQLHRGGELGSMSPQQAMDPGTNANTALSQFASVQRSRGLTGGALAAAAQRPANPGAYAQQVNAKMGQARQILQQAGFFNQGGNGQTMA